MGCYQSRILESKRLKSNSLGIQSTESYAVVVPLSEEQKELLVESWASLKDDMARVGVITFIK